MWDICGTKAQLRVRDTAFAQVIRGAPVPAVTVCKTVGTHRGALPCAPALPRRLSMGSSPRPGRQSPTPEPPGMARARFYRPCGQTLAIPGEPGVARRVPDRGDDLTHGGAPCH
jgi:hypothetical protein